MGGTTEEALVLGDKHEAGFDIPHLRWVPSAVETTQAVLPPCKGFALGRTGKEGGEDEGEGGVVGPKGGRRAIEQRAYVRPMHCNQTE